MARYRPSLRLYWTNRPVTLRYRDRKAIGSQSGSQRSHALAVAVELVTHNERHGRVRHFSWWQSVMKFAFSDGARAALLAVLLLVAVNRRDPPRSIEKLALSRTVAAMRVAMDQARFHADGLPSCVLTLDDLRVRHPDWSKRPGQWNGTVRRVPLPGGGLAQARLLDGGNCFNINSVVEGDVRTGLTRRHSGVLQFVGLMQALEVPAAEAAQISEAAADWVDSDSVPGGRRRGSCLSGGR